MGADDATVTSSHRSMAAAAAAAAFSAAATTLLFLLAAATAVAAAAPVPAIYVLGDSIVDVGNNNYLPTFLRADLPHNGIDYPGSNATGRFSNGKNCVDFIADDLGLASPPPYLALPTGNANYANGVNFASGGAGVSKAINKGKCISFDEQIDYFSSVHASLAQRLGKAQAAAHLSKSIFVINIGGNDISHYAKSSSGPGNHPPPQQFADALIRTLTGQLQRLYDLGARKLVFLGAGPVGCCPSLRKLSAAKECNAVANDASVRFNAGAASLLAGMAARHRDMRYAFFDSSAAMLPLINTPAAYGFAESRVACCGLGDMNAKIGCTPLSVYCPNRRTHVFWDFYHPTEATAKKLTSMAFDGSAPLIFPMNIKQLSAL